MALGLWERGELFLCSAQRARVAASCVRLSKFDGLADGGGPDGTYTGEVELVDESDGGFACQLPVASELVQAILGVPASVLLPQFLHEDKAVRKLAKQKTKAAQAAFTQLEGTFVLGSGPCGLTIVQLPQRAPLAELS